MRETVKKWFGFFRRGRGGLAIIVGGVLVFCGLAGFSVKTSSGLPSAILPAAAIPAAPETRPIGRYFGLERLDAFSGNDFNLFPDLMNLLDVLEQHLAASPSSGPSYQDYTRFTNPDFVKFQIYTIQGRDNYWLVSKRFGYTIDTIVGCNPQLEKVVCYRGQKILLPSRGGCLHHVQPEETLDTIALMYAVDPDVILQANRINRKWGIIPDMYLFIPGAKPRHLTESMHKEYTRRALFRSPLSGRYTSFVGRRIHPVLGFSKFHNGVDIACHQGTWVGAAAGGVVEYAGWGGAVGLYVKINHQNGYETVYGHLSKVYIRTGQKVRGGQLIARSGSTGRSTGPHLHFTIYDHGQVRDPMSYLW